MCPSNCCSSTLLQEPVSPDGLMGDLLGELVMHPWHRQHETNRVIHKQVRWNIKAIHYAACRKVGSTLPWDHVFFCVSIYLSAFSWSPQLIVCTVSVFSFPLSMLFHAAQVKDWLRLLQNIRPWLEWCTCPTSSSPLSLLLLRPDDDDDEDLLMSPLKRGGDKPSPSLLELLKYVMNAFASSILVHISLIFSVCST